MNYLKSNKNPKIIELSKTNDKRGYFIKSFNKSKTDKLIPFEIYEQFYTYSKKNVLRGFHFQSKYKQAKFVSVLKGKIFDCVIDLRKSSKTFGKTYGIILSEKNCLSLYIPEGFAHAYYSFSPENIIYYKLSNYYQPKFEDGIYWKDKSLKVKWPCKKPILNKDTNNNRARSAKLRVAERIL